MFPLRLLQLSYETRWFLCMGVEEMTERHLMLACLGICAVAPIIVYLLLIGGNE